MIHWEGREARKRLGRRSLAILLHKPAGSLVNTGKGTINYTDKEVTVPRVAKAYRQTVSTPI